MDDDYEYTDAVIAQVNSNGKAEELWLQSDEDFLDYIIKNGSDCDLCFRGLRHGQLPKELSVMGGTLL